MKELKTHWAKASNKVLSALLPSLALRVVKKALLKPKKKPSNWPKHVKQFDINTRYGQVNTYRYGEGKCIWLIHGWSGSAFDFWPLMQKLTEKGYSTITFDFPAHGNSKGEFSSLLQMIKVFDEISTQLLAPNMVISHGTGASTIANSKWFRSYHKDLLLISPILDIYQFLQNRKYLSGFDDVLFNQVVHDLSKRENIAIKELCTITKLQNFVGQLKTIHDTQDGLAPFNLTEKFTQSSDTTLVITNKLGHNRILQSRKLLNLIESYKNPPLKDSLCWHNVS